MNINASPTSAIFGRRRTAPSLVPCGIAIALADLAFAAVFWAGRDGLDPLRIPQSIAAWVLGREAAFAGEWPAALLGFALYAYLTTAMVAGYRALARRWPTLLRRPFIGGTGYGIAMYALLFRLAVPSLSVAAPRAEPPEWIAACLLAFAGLVGVPCALFARFAARLERVDG